MTFVCFPAKILPKKPRQSIGKLKAHFFKVDHLLSIGSCAKFLSFTFQLS